MRTRGEMLGERKGHHFYFLTFVLDLQCKVGKFTIVTKIYLYERGSVVQDTHFKVILIRQTLQTPHLI